MAAGKKERILAALGSIYPRTVAELIQDVKRTPDADVDDLYSTWMGYTKEDWKSLRSDLGLSDGFAIYNALQRIQDLPQSIGPSPAGEVRRVSNEDERRRVEAARENFNTGKGEALYDDININSPHLDRSVLVSKLAQALEVSPIVVISSPPATGKTSLYRLYKKAYEDCEGGTVRAIVINIRGPVSLEELLNLYANFNIRTCRLTYPSSRSVVVFLDDAQSRYEQDLELWALLVKQRGSFEGQIRFVIAATHSVDNFQISPIVLKEFTKLSLADFLLSSEESMTYLQLGSNIGLPQHMRFAGLMDRLVDICGGLIGALRMSIRALRNRFKENAANEDDLIRFLFSWEFCDSMERCYGARTVKHRPPMVSYLQSCFGKPTPYKGFDDNRDVVDYENLRKRGILLEETVPGGRVTRFTSSLAKRYYIQGIFPDRATVNPKSLKELIKHAVRHMSPTTLSQACGPPECGRQLPKEAVFQHLFMAGLTSGTLSTTHICPELSQVFETGHTINGEIDFFVNGQLCWGIELVIGGDNLGGHMDRFRNNGPYVPLNCGDNWYVVDFRISKGAEITNVRKDKNRISVFYEEGGDFSFCNVAIGECDKGERWEYKLK